VRVRVRQARDAVARSPTWARQTVALLSLAAIGWVAWTGLDALLRLGLWGEWVFAMIGCSLAILLIGIYLGRFWRALRIVPPRFWQTPLWAAVPLVGVPMAALTRPWGIVIFAGVLAVALVALSRVTRTPYRWLEPVHWVAAVAAIGAVTAYAWSRTPGDTAAFADATRRVPDAAQLAYLYRPVLFFDGSERFFPMNIRRAMKDGEVEECRYAVGGDDCRDVNNPTELDDNYDFLSITGGVSAHRDETGGPDSTYYVHVVRTGTNVFLDYWWYYAENPLPVAKAILCGPGLRAPEISCFEHPADWEGLTVVLGACSSAPATGSRCEQSLHVVAVKYAEHRDVKRFDWSTLTSMWNRYGLSPGNQERPLVFVALDSHASYPVPCKHGQRCGVESHYDGRLAWRNNGDACGQRCLELLPTKLDGTPSSWNAFPGHWGKQTCILLGAYCDVGPAPRAPAFQGRYKHP
jgi:hypothetical protein